MKQEMIAQIGCSLENFRLPRYREIPNVGLYLEQTTKYIGDVLAPLGEEGITSSMISNYVKRGVVANPVRKQYDRDRIAYLIFAMCAKKVLVTDHIKLMIAQQKKTYTPEKAYDYFCDEFENILRYVFGLKDTVDVVGEENTAQKIMLRNCIITAAHKIYLDKLFCELERETD